MRSAADRTIHWLVATCCLAVGVWFALRLVAEDSLITSVLWAVPFVLIAGWILVFQLKTFYWLIPALVPISVNLTDIGGGIGFSLPVEAFIWLLSLLLAVKYCFEPILDVRIFRHPITWLIGLQTFWVFVTFVLSTENLVSAKFMLSRIVYVWVFYFFTAGVFAESRNIFRFHRLYLFSILPVILYALWKLSMHGFAQKYSPAMSQPFYSDHTVYGASIAMILPATLLLWHHRKKIEMPQWVRGALAPVSFLLLVAALFSYSRAAWLSLVVCAGFYVLMRLRVPFLAILTLLVLAGGGAYLLRDEILVRMEANQVKGERTLVSHAQSITDVDRDESNKERINRWTAALAMYRDKPLTGFGPGTFESHYGIYQTSLTMTRISTKQGNKGDAHSEYLGVLAEQGMPGLIIWIAMVLGSIATGMRAVYRAQTHPERIAALGILLGLITYFVHGAVNSFLDIEKVNSLFWSSLAALVMLEFRTRRQPEPQPHIKQL